MNAPTRPASAADILADAHARLLAAGIVMADAIIAAQEEGLDCEPTLRTIHHELLAVADRQVEQLEAMAAATKPRKLRLVSADDPLAGMCARCGGILDHSTTCPEVSP